jgi:hypothetical protein
VALEYATLPNDPEELKQLVLKHARWLEALKAEVIRLRRWRYGRSCEVLDVSRAPELPLAGGATSTTAAPPVTVDAPRPPRLVAVDAPGGKRTAGVRRAPSQPSSRG